MKIFLEQTSIDNGEASLKNLIALLGVKVSKRTLDEVKNYPNYPSIGALSGCLTEWNIKNISVRLKSSQLNEIPYPAIAHLNKNAGHFVVLQKFEQNLIQYIDSEVGLVRETIEEFSKKWTGVILLVEANEKSGAENYQV